MATSRQTGSRKGADLELAFDSKRGELVLKRAGKGLGRMGLITGPWDSRKGVARVEGCQAEGPGVISIRIEFTDGPVVEWSIWQLETALGARFRIENTTGTDIQLHEAGLEGELAGQGPVEPGTIRFLDGMSGGGFTSVERKEAHDSENNLLLTFRGTHPAGRQSVVAGGLSYEDFAKYARMELDSGTGTTRFSLMARDAVGRLLAPDESYAPADWFYLDCVEADPFESLERYGLAVREAMGANPNPYDFVTVCGWYASMSLYGAGDYINTTTGMVSEADAANQSGLTRYTRIACRLVPDTYDRESLRSVDVGNFHPSILSEGRDTEQGWWDDAHFQKYGHFTEPYETFGKWGRAMTGKGAVPLFYVQSGLVSYDYAKAHPGHMLNNDISRLDDVFEQTPHVTYDYTDPDFQEHVSRIWETMGEAGIGGVMFDYPHLAWHDTGGFEDPRSTTAAAYRKMFALARKGLGPEARIHENLVKKRWPHYVDMTIGLVDSQRICGDNDRARPDFYKRAALRWYKNRVLYTYDMDAKHVHRVLPGNRDGFRSLLTMLYATASRIILAHTTKWLTADHVKDLGRIFPVHDLPRSPRPLDAFTRDGCPGVFDFPVNEDWHQVVLYNEDTDNPAKREVPLSVDAAEGGMGLDRADRFHVYDFWNDTFAGCLSGSDLLVQELRPGEARMLSVRKVLDHPQVISTNRHVLQGLVDMHNVDWDPKSGVLSGEADVVEDDPYTFVVATNGYGFISVESNGSDAWIDSPAWDASLLKVNLHARKSGRIRWEVWFGKDRQLKPTRTDYHLDNGLCLGEQADPLMDHVSTGYRLVGGPPVSSLDKRFAMERETHGDRVSYRYADRHGSGIDMILHVESPGPSSRILILELVNRGQEPVRFESIEVCEGRLPGAGFTGKVIPNSYWVGYRSEEEKIYSPVPGRTYTNAFWTLTMESPALAAGFITGCHTVNRFDLTLLDGDYRVRAYGEADGVTLLPGERRFSDSLFLSFRTDPLAGMERFGDLAGKGGKSTQLDKNAATWCSWYSGWLGRQRQQYLRKWKGGLEAGVASQIEPIARLLGKRGGACMRIVDDSRQMSLGDWDDQTEKMTKGYGQMAMRMREAGVDPGVWITPFYVGTASRLFEEHPEFLVRDEQGEVFLPGYAGIPCGILDSTVDGAREHFRKMGALWRERGYRYVMTDFLRSQFFAPLFEDRTLTKTEAHRIALEALREGFGDDIYWLACTALPGPCMGLADGFRVSGDSFGGITKKGGPFAYTQCAYRWFYHRRVWLNDPDSIISRGYWNFKEKAYIRESHPVPYLQAYFSWIALAGLVVTYGDTFDDDLPEANLEVYRRIFPPMPIAGRPLDLWEHDPHYLWGVKASDNAEHPLLLGAFSLFEESPIHIRTRLDEAVRRIHGFDTEPETGTSYRAWDYWNNCEVPVKDGWLDLELDPQTCRLIALAPVSNRPRLLSTSGHFSQGALELADLSWKKTGPGKGALTGNVTGNAGEGTALYLSLPCDPERAEASLDGVAVSLVHVDGDVYRLDVPGSEAPTVFKLTAPTDTRDTRTESLAQTSADWITVQKRENGPKAQK